MLDFPLTLFSSESRVVAKVRGWRRRIILSEKSIKTINALGKKRKDLKVNLGNL